MTRDAAKLYIAIEDIVTDLKDIDLENHSKEDIALQVRGVIALGEYILKVNDDVLNN